MCELAMPMHAGKCLSLEDDFVDDVIVELKQLWPECSMVRGRPRHSPSNGGVERYNLQVRMFYHSSCDFLMSQAANTDCRVSTQYPNPRAGGAEAGSLDARQQSLQELTRLVSPRCWLPVRDLMHGRTH